MSSPEATANGLKRTTLKEGEELKAQEPILPAPTIITAGEMSFKKYINDLLDHRQLLRFFIWRDIVVRYKQAVLGIAWVVIKPLLTMLLFTLIFGLIARFPSENVSYPLFVLAGMLPWQYFANCSADCCSALLNNSQLITKAYFPRVILPLSMISAQIVDMAVNLVIFLLLIPFLGSFPPLINLATLPLLTLWTYILSVGAGLWLAPLTVKYRDVRFLMAFVIQFGMFLSPVGYGTFIIPSKWLWLYSLNPLVGLIDAFRWSLLGQSHPYILWTVSYALGATLLLFVTGLKYFKRTEEELVDLL
ncbi:MAG: ABC transporter permease [Parachlamydiales bacterium]|jgi:lipopolysaccharide transport system permease protein